MGRSVLTQGAKLDIHDIWQYIARDKVSAADRFIDRIVDTIEEIADSPRIGIARPEFGESIRSYPVDRYVIVYRIEDDTIKVGMIRAGDVDLPRHVRRLRWD